MAGHVEKRTGIKVLHVDDEGYFLALTKKILERGNKDFTVKSVTSAEEGRALLKNANYDVVIADYQMPGMDGLRFLQHLREEGDTIPFIMLTGRGREEVAIEALNRGADHYLQKGGDRESMYGTLAHVIHAAVAKKSVASLLDVTGLKRVEEALRKSEGRFRLLAENAQDIIFRIQLVPTPHFQYISPAVTTILGYTPEEHYADVNLGFKIVHPDDRPLFREMMQGDRALKEPILIRWIRKDGTIVWIEERITPVYDEEGTLVALEGIARDIPERKRVEAAVRESEKKLSQIVHGSPIPKFVIDTKHSITHWNKACERLTGFSADEMVGTNKQWMAFYPSERPVMADFVVDHQPKEVIATYYGAKCQQSDLIEGAYEASDFFPHLGTSGKWLFFTASPLRGAEGEMYGAIETLQDITERKRAEEERESFLKELKAKNAELERFTYTVSHDLASPLFAIRGFTTLAREDLEQGNTEHLASDLERIESAAAKMDLLLKDTLKLSRIGRVANPPEDVSFGEIVEEALEQTVEHIESSGVEVSVAEDFPTVRVDRMRIVEVLVNLIGNSIKYRGSQPTLKIEIGYRLDGKETVFFVKDNGIGIDESQHEKVFELFYKVDNRSTGTGAGLAIVKRIIEVHGGHIWIESEEGKGCTICFTLLVVRG
jgi:PAS domain S-box-containing protein